MDFVSKLEYLEAAFFPLKSSYHLTPNIAKNEVVFAILISNYIGIMPKE